MEALRAGPPQYDLGLVEHGPRTGTRGKGADRQVQRTTARQPDFGLRAVQRDRDLPVTDVTARSTEGGQSLAGLQHGLGRRTVRQGFLSGKSMYVRGRLGGRRTHKK